MTIPQSIKDWIERHEKQDHFFSFGPNYISACSDAGCLNVIDSIHWDGAGAIAFNLLMRRTGIAHENIDSINLCA